MKVFYKEKTVLDEIKEHIANAVVNNKYIDHIEVTQYEFDELNRILFINPGGWFFKRCDQQPDNFYFEYDGIKIIKENNNEKNKNI